MICFLSIAQMLDIDLEAEIQAKIQKIPSVYTKSKMEYPYEYPMEHKKPS